MTGDPDMIAKATALNGAQVQSLLELVMSVVRKEVPERTAETLIQMAFPDIADPLVKRLLASARGFTPAPPPASAKA